MIHVLDAGPMMAYLQGELGDDVVTQILVDNPGECYAHVFNLTEVYDVFFRSGGSGDAETAIDLLLDAGIIPRDDADEAFWKEVGTLKGSHALSLPDGFCIAVARRLSGIAVTTDHSEFDPLVPFGYCPNRFIR